MIYYQRLPKKRNTYYILIQVLDWKFWFTASAFLTHVWAMSRLTERRFVSSTLQWNAIISSLISHEPRWACMFHCVCWKEQSPRDHCSSTRVEKGKGPNFSQIDWLSWIVTRKWNKHALSWFLVRASMPVEWGFCPSFCRKEGKYI